MPLTSDEHTNSKHRPPERKKYINKILLAGQHWLTPRLPMPCMVVSIHVRWGFRVLGVRVGAPAMGLEWPGMGGTSHLVGCLTHQTRS